MGQAGEPPSTPAAPATTTDVACEADTDCILSFDDGGRCCAACMCEPPTVVHRRDVPPAAPADDEFCARVKCSTPTLEECTEQCGGPPLDMAGWDTRCDAGRCAIVPPS